MASLISLVIFSTLVNSVMSIKLPEKDVSCGLNEFWNKEEGQCVRCSECNAESGLVRWVNCAANRDTLCGPAWFPFNENRRQDATTASDHMTESRDNTSEQIQESRGEWTAFAYMCGMLTILAGLVLWLLVSCLKKRESRKGLSSDSLVSGAYRVNNDYVKIEDLPKMTNSDATNDHTYVRMEDLP